MGQEHEPTAEELALVDNDPTDLELQEPDPTNMSEDKYTIELNHIEGQRRGIRFKQGQIKRWMAYQYVKDHDINPKDTGNHNPYNALLAKLTGREIWQPRRKTTVNVWHKSQNNEINEQVRQQYGVVKNANLASWELYAKIEHKRALEDWREEVDRAPSTDPVNQQRCIQGLVRFVQPILDIICDATGWKATLIAGGPEPAQGGQLNVISIHSGTTSGDVKLSFGQAEHVQIKKQLIPMFGSFLKKCYTPEECRSRAISELTGGCLPLSEGEFDSSVVSIFEVPITAATAYPNSRTTESHTTESVENPALPNLPALDHSN